MLVNIPATYVASGFFSFPKERRREIAVTQKVLGDARERDGECQLFLLTAAGSCEVAYPETRSPGWKSASVGRAQPLPCDASITGSRAHENPLSIGYAGLQTPRRAGLHKAVP